MVGDKYRWDYKSARDAGIDAILIEAEYNKDDIETKKIKRTIRRLSDVFDYI